MTSDNWKFDEAHTQIGFSVKHMMIAKVRGRFTNWSGELSYDPENPLDAHVRAEIDVASVDTQNEQRDAHLRSADFFDAENFPQMTFESTKWRVVGDDYEIDGDLTIRGTTRPVKIRVQSSGIGTDPWGQTRVGFSGSAVINRKDFGLTWNQALETGGVLVGEDVEIELEVQAIAAEAASHAAAE